MALFVLSLCPFDISVGVGAFVIGLSQISSFFSFDGCMSSILAMVELFIKLTAEFNFCDGYYNKAMAGIEFSDC